jgi:hypothetical protein
MRGLTRHSYPTHLIGSNLDIVRSDWLWTFEQVEAFRLLIYGKETLYEMCSLSRAVRAGPSIKQ